MALHSELKEKARALSLLEKDKLSAGIKIKKPAEAREIINNISLII